MKTLQTIVKSYLSDCKCQKCLDSKTIKAYQIDLNQFLKFATAEFPSEVTPGIIEDFIAHLHNTYKPKSAKRKIASLKAFFHYLEFKDIIEKNPFNKIRVHFREPEILPKTIPLDELQRFLATISRQCQLAPTDYQRRNAVRDLAVFELLFATGIRISELCALKPKDMNLSDGTILIYGKGSKERRLQTGTPEVLQEMRQYNEAFSKEISACDHFFANQSGRPLSDQAVRRTLKKYCSLAAVETHATPHMFRHTFATSLLEADVDIRYIQEMLGHSSITITEIYTHVAVSKQRDILSTKHPRNYLNF